MSDTRVFVGKLDGSEWTELHGVRDVLLNRPGAPGEAIQPLQPYKPRELSFTMKGSARFVRMMVGWSYLRRPPYKRNKHRYGR